MTARRERRWRSAIATTYVLVAVALYTGSATLVIAATVPLFVLLVGAVTSTPDPSGVTIRRRLESSRVGPDQPVSVALSVHNESERSVPDLRVIDGVPPDLAVVSGSPRGGWSLGPGETAELEYTLTSRRGTHEFTDPTVRLRGIGGVTLETVTLPVSGADTIVCELDVEQPPIEPVGDTPGGTLETGLPGEGVVFHSIREHRSDDPAHRLDWRQYAKTRELATVSYERTMRTAVVVVLDARSINRVLPGPGRPSGLELSGYACAQLLTAVLERGHDVGLGIVGRQDPTGPRLRWLPPGGGRDHRVRALAAIEWALESETSAANPRDQLQLIIEQTPADGQLVVVSPLLDDWPVGMVERCLKAGLPVTVVSPDVLADNTVSGTLEAIDRHSRLATSQTDGAAVVDWRRSTPLERVLQEAVSRGRGVV